MSAQTLSSFMNCFRLGLVTILIFFLTSCSFSSQKIIKVDLYPIPYYIEVPADIARHLTVENMDTNSQNEYTKQAKKAGAIAQVYVNYLAKDGTTHGFAGVYYFKKADYEKSANPNEPPVYGTMVAEENSMVLLVYGPQESIFEPSSQDGKNSIELYTLMYDPDAYSYKNK